MTQTTCRCGGNFEITGPLKIYECRECGASRPKSDGGAIPQTTKLISRSQALDQAVFDAWSRFGESVGYYSNRAVERLSKPDALMFILARFKWYNLI